MCMRSKILTNPNLVMSSEAWLDFLPPETCTKHKVWLSRKYSQPSIWSTLNHQPLFIRSSWEAVSRIIYFTSQSSQLHVADEQLGNLMFQLSSPYNIYILQPPKSALHHRPSFIWCSWEEAISWIAYSQLHEEVENQITLSFDPHRLQPWKAMSWSRGFDPLMMHCNYQNQKQQFDRLKPMMSHLLLLSLTSLTWPPRLLLAHHHPP